VEGKGTKREAIKRIFLAGIVAIGVFGVSGLMLSELLGLSERKVWDGTQSALWQLERVVDQIIEEEGTRPIEKRVNRAIKSGLQEEPPDSPLHRLKEEISKDPRLDRLSSLPIFVEKDDLSNGFGFYWKGEDGLSRSGGMDPDDINSWDQRSGQFYLDRRQRETMLRYAELAMIPTLVVFALLIRMTGKRSFRDRMARIVKRVFLFIGVPVGLLMTPVLVVGVLIFGFPFSRSGHFTPSWKSELPSTATEVYEEGSGEKIPGDYSYRMRAKVSEEEFADFCKRLEMTLHTEDREYDDLEYGFSWEGNPAGCGGWWVPTDSTEETFVWQKGHTWSYAKYEDGHLYFGSFKH